MCSHVCLKRFVSWKDSITSFAPDSTFRERSFVDQRLNHIRPRSAPFRILTLRAIRRRPWRQRRIALGRACHLRCLRESRPRGMRRCARKIHRPDYFVVLERRRLSDGRCKHPHHLADFENGAETDLNASFTSDRQQCQHALFPMSSLQHSPATSAQSTQRIDYASPIEPTLPRMQRHCHIRFPLQIKL